MNTPTDFADKSSNGKTPRPTATSGAAEHDDLVRSHDLERVADALHYLDNVRPLEGCDFTADEDFHAGRSTLLRLLELEVRRLAWPAEDEPASAGSP